MIYSHFLKQTTGKMCVSAYKEVYSEFLFVLENNTSKHTDFLIRLKLNAIDMNMKYCFILNDAKHKKIYWYFC